MVITAEHDNITKTPYYLAEQRHNGRLILAEGRTRDQAMDRCLDTMLDSDLRALAEEVNSLDTV